MYQTSTALCVTAATRPPLHGNLAAPHACASLSLLSCSPTPPPRHVVPLVRPRSLLHLTSIVRPCCWIHVRIFLVAGFVSVLVLTLFSFFHTSCQLFPRPASSVRPSVRPSSQEKRLNSRMSNEISFIWSHNFLLNCNANFQRFFWIFHHLAFDQR